MALSIIMKLANKFMKDYARKQGQDVPEVDLDVKNLPPKLSDLISFRSSNFFQGIKNYFKEEAVDSFSDINNVKVVPSSSVGEKEAVNEVDGLLYGSFPNSDWWDEIDRKDVANIVEELKTKHSLNDKDVIEYMEEIGGANEDIISEVQSILNKNVSALPRRQQKEGTMSFEDALDSIKEED
tara:strand:+ start:284 stop:829 length:546 start_codon:yes stop_codon:yes gene_type:complete